MTRVLMMASYGLEIVECGGAIATALAAGDSVHAAVLMCREESRPQVGDSAKALGITAEVDFMDVAFGEVDFLGEAKTKVVSLIRRVKPDIIIMQDPEHAQHDLDPDRRVIAILYAEALSVAGRDWQIEACGGHQPHPVPTIFYMTPERPNCVVEIGEHLPKKLDALAVLTSQNTFSAEHWLAHTSPEILKSIVPAWTDGKTDTLGLEGQRTLFTALAISSGLASHSGAVLGEPYRREGTFLLDRLVK